MKTPILVIALVAISFFTGYMYSQEKGNNSPADISVNLYQVSCRYNVYDKDTIPVDTIWGEVTYLPADILYIP